MHYDYLIVGAGLFGACFAHEMYGRGKRCLLIDKRDHIAGNIYTEESMGIQVHKYGAHIFHTSDKEIWDYIEMCIRDRVRTMMLRHAALLKEYKGEYTAVREMRKHVCWYTAGYPHSARLRERINEMETMEQLEEIICMKSPDPA